jgi:hypothetical protein
LEKIIVPLNKPRNTIAKDLRSPKYHMRVVSCKKQYNRSVDKNAMRKELAYGISK